MHMLRVTVGTAIVLCLTLAPIDAASKGKGPVAAKVSSPKAPAAAKTTQSPKQSPKTTKTTAKVTKPPKGTTTAKASSTPKTRTTKTKTTTTSGTKPAKADTRSAEKSRTTSTTTSPTTMPAPTTPIDFTKGKVGERLTRNTKLSEKLANQLTAMGYTGNVYEAGYGFKNLGQFVAAVNNAQNHDLAFEQLKTLMTGVSVSAEGIVLYANRNPDGTVTMVPLEDVTDPAPTKSLGQAKKTIEAPVVETETTTPMTVTH
jgi:hypothetical protein